MQDKIQQDLKQAMLARDEVTTSTLRMLISEIRNTQIAKGGELSDSDITSVIQKEVKRRKEAVLGFRQGGREEAALKEESEAKVLETYLPEQMTDQELIKLVESSINELGASSIQDMGKVIGVVRTKVGDQAEGGRISALVKSRLS